MGKNFQCTKLYLLLYLFENNKDPCRLNLWLTALVIVGSQSVSQTLIGPSASGGEELLTNGEVEAEGGDLTQMSALQPSDNTPILSVKCTMPREDTEH